MATTFWPMRPRRERGHLVAGRRRAWACVVAATAWACSEDAPAAGADAGADVAVTAGDAAGDDGFATDGAATADAADAAWPGPTTISLPPQSLDGDGVTADIGFDIPAGTVSFALTAAGEAAVRYTFEALVDPTGTVWAPADWSSQDKQTGGQMCLTCQVRVVPQQGAAALLVPNPAGTPLPPGTWAVRVKGQVLSGGGGFSAPKTSPASGVVAVTVTLQPGPATALATLDVNLFWSGAKDLTAATAPGSPLVLGWLAELATIYEQAGVALGEVRHFDLAPGWEVVEALEQDNSDFAGIGAQTVDAPPGLNLAMVREITSPFGGLGGVLGVAGGIPGPVGVQGTARSVVVVALADLPGGPGGEPKPHEVGLTMAHEGGHYLGLFHTSENDWGGFGPKISDPLDDTSVPAKDNIMHFDGGSGGTALTAMQGAVVRSNPWLRGKEGKR